MLVAIFRGILFTVLARFLRPRVKVGRGLRIYGRLVVRGPGTVTLGDDVQIHGRVTPFTHRATAAIQVGDRTKLDGTRFSCVGRITIGADCLIANGRLLDTSFHATSAQAAYEGRITESPIIVGDGVWISLDAALLPGTTIGDHSVVALGAVCKGEFPGDVMILGNPARVAGRLA